MMLRRLYIKFKIWRIQSQIKDIVSETNLFWVSLVSLNVKHDAKMDVDKMFNIFVVKQAEKKKNLLKELKRLQNILNDL